MLTKKNNNLENIQQNLVSNRSCRGQNKTIMSTRLLRLKLYFVLVHLIHLLNINLCFTYSGYY